MKKVLLAAVFFASFGLFAQYESTDKNKFKQLKEELATPNSYRTASGAPGHEYYQNRANYVMNVILDESKQTIHGEETITYVNNSPDELVYLWVQLDQNMRAKDSDTYKIQQSSIKDKMTNKQIRDLEPWFDGGFKLDYVKDKSGKDLEYTVVKTMMRVNLPTPLKSKGSYTFKIKWWYNINDRMEIGGRSGYEYFEDEDNYIFTIAQFFPRMAVYNEVEGWQHKQFLGRGEFTLPFGDYDVSITVPSDHVVGATGTIQNMSSVLTSNQRDRYKKAQNSFDKPVFIVTEEEAKEAEKSKKKGTKIWQFSAKNVRDFAFASSRKFIWDAQNVKMNTTTSMAMSLYPKEGNPLWEMYSTKVTAHTLREYSKYTIDYPYPVAYSVHSKWIGMEYPMICFNGGRPEPDGTYSARTKAGMLGVIIHEVGHNFFPMIINSDERQWTWMDEGLNTFVQYLTEQTWEPDYPSRRGPANKIVDYMKGDKTKISPIMTNSESIFQFGNNAYGKPATALNILRETILGRELFDYAFKEYARRWAFKHPTPADFFRTMEDASGVDLDWFWRGWFYSTEHVDIAINNVKWFKLDTKNPEFEKAEQKKIDDEKYENQSIINWREVPKLSDKDSDLLDFYSKLDKYEVSKLDKKEYDEYLNSLDEDEKVRLKEQKNYYEMEFELVGGLPMPIILEFTYADGTRKKEYIPAEIWKQTGQTKATKVFVSDKELVGVILDPNFETADVDVNNNYWPPKMIPTRFEMFKQRERKSPENEMQRAKRAEELE